MPSNEEERSMANLEKINVWRRGLHLAMADIDLAEASSLCECTSSDTSGVNDIENHKGITTSTVSPRTPVRSMNISRTNFKGASPTDTIFSSVFDSPGPCERAKDGALSDTSSSTSVADEEVEDEGKEKDNAYCENQSHIPAQTAHHHIFEAKSQKDDDLNAPSLNSVEPPSTPSRGSLLSHDYNDSEADDPFTSPALGPTLEDLLSPPPLPPGTPQQVFITSCYQCLVADLPCSRTLPACSRCKRGGYAELCLVQRRKLLREMIPGDVEGNNTPILLRMKNGKEEEEGEEEEIWRRKLELRDELQVCWKEKEERRNWVIPPIESPRGGFSKRRGMKKMRQEHPGEGKGRLTFLSVKLA